MPAPRHLLFDIDGTVIEDGDFRTVHGRRFLDCLGQLAARGYRFGFITGNDYRVQQRRFLGPLKEAGHGQDVFCFSDGGSRAFEYSAAHHDFREVADYSTPNIMTDAQVAAVRETFESTNPEFVGRHGHLVRPGIRWASRTLDYIDLRLSPLRPSFARDEQAHQEFCNRIREFARSSEIRSTTFQLLPESSGLILRAHGRSPDSDAATLQDLLAQRLLHEPQYRELARPELDLRGGSVTCQIALKPFNDERLRADYLDLFRTELERRAPGEFSVTLGGRTTIDVQRHGVDKAKAVRFYAQRRQVNPDELIYFGNEFVRHGNDLAVASMCPPERPVCVVNVGRPAEPQTAAESGFIDAGGGPAGTLNYLRFLLVHLA